MKPSFQRAAALVLASICLPSLAADQIFNVTAFGAIADGKSKCTAALQKAIDAAGNNGAGVVEFPTGTFLSGPLLLRNGVTLQFDAGSTLLGSRDMSDYSGYAAEAPKPKAPFHNLIHADGLRHVAIRGEGTIDGNGDAFPDPHEKLQRPHNLYFCHCRDVLVEGVHLRSAGSWMQDYKLCTNVVIRNISVFNHVTHNNDGLDIDSSQNVAVTDCHVDSDDDGICLKSTTAVPCRHVQIIDCAVSSHCNALKLGTESGGGFSDIVISNCMVTSPAHSKAINGEQRGEAAIALETVDGGKLENVTVSNIKIDGVMMPIFLRLGDRARRYGRSERPAVGIFSNVTLKNIEGEHLSPLGCAISGLPGHRITNVRFENIHLTFEGGGDRLDFAHKDFQPRQSADDPDNIQRPIPERPDAYPGFNMFGMLPAYGFYCRHVDDLHFENVILHTEAPDKRHALMFDDARAITINQLQVDGSPGGAALFGFTQSPNVTINALTVHGRADLLARLAGTETRNIRLQNSDVSNVQQISAASSEVPPGAFAQTP